MVPMPAARTSRGECLALLGALAATIAYSNCFASPAAAPRGSPSAASPLREGPLRASGAAAGSLGAAAAGGGSRAGLCGLVAAAVAVGALRSEHRRRRATVTACRAFGFGSSSSGFMGDSTATAYIASEPVQVADAEAPLFQPDVCGLTGMMMRGNVWWEKPTGKDEKWGRVFDWERRESRRRGEELFRHDVDNFEMRTVNIIPAPGSQKKKIVLGRSKYGHKGRTCGFGQKGAGKRGRRTMPPGYQASMAPFHHIVPKMKQADKEVRRVREANKRMASITIKDLERCDDGDELDYEEMFMRGLKGRKNRFQQVKVFCKEEHELTVKNLTVYAHYFEPTAREKIEALGGTCVRLDEISNIPVQLEFKRQQEQA